MIDAKRYMRLKDKCVTSIECIDECWYLVFKRFSVEDGSEIPSEKQLIEIDKIIAKRDDIASELEAFNTVIEDIVALMEMGV